MQKIEPDAASRAALQRQVHAIVTTQSIMKTPPPTSPQVKKW